MSLPERLARSLFAGAGGALEEGAQLLLPRLVRRSRFYDVTAKNMLRLATELLGGVERPHVEDGEPDTQELLVKKTAGNALELGTIAAFGFSPLWLLAGAADVLNGTRVYLRTLEAELARAGVISPDTHFASVDQLVGALEGAAGETANLIDLPPLELKELRASLEELRRDAAALPSPVELGRLFQALLRAARAERRSLLEVSSGVGLAFLTSARRVGRQHLVTPYREDWAPVAREGFAAYATRISRPYRDALAGHFDPAQATYTERVPRYTRQALAWVQKRLRHRRGGPQGGASGEVTGR